MTTKVCTHCGGSNVFYDAFVGVNDPTDVRTFDATFCDDCGGETTLRFAAKFVLIGNELGDDGEWLYWSNTDGWVDRESATVFSEAEMAVFTEPQDTFAWRAVG